MGICRYYSMYSCSRQSSRDGNPSCVAVPPAAIPALQPYREDCLQNATRSPECARPCTAECIPVVIVTLLCLFATLAACDCHGFLLPPCLLFGLFGRKTPKETPDEEEGDPIRRLRKSVRSRLYGRGNDKKACQEAGEPVADQMVPEGEAGGSRIVERIDAIPEIFEKYTEFSVMDEEELIQLGLPPDHEPMPEELPAIGGPVDDPEIPPDRDEDWSALDSILHGPADEPIESEEKWLEIDDLLNGTDAPPATPELLETDLIEEPVPIDPLPGDAESFEFPDFSLPDLKAGPDDTILPEKPDTDLLPEPAAADEEPDIASLIADLRGNNADVRKQAISALGKAGTPAIDPLIRVLADSDDRIRWSCAEALQTIGDPAVSPLIRALKDPHLQLGAAMALVKMGEPAVSDLIQALADSDGDIQIGAGYALEEIGACAMPYLEDALHGSDDLLREKAAEVLGSLGWKPGDETERVQFLIAKDKWVDAAAAGEQAIEPLLASLISEDDDIRRNAARALGEIGTPAIKPLIEALSDENATLRTMAAMALAEIGIPAIPALIGALDDGRSRPGAASALVRIGEPAVDRVMDVFRDSSGPVEQVTGDILAGIGEPAVAPLIHLLVTARFRNRRKAAAVLDRLGWEPWEDAEKAYYLIAREQWMELTRSGSMAVDPLIHALCDDSDHIRREAAETLGQIGDPRAIKPLITALHDASVRVEAGEALVSIGDSAVEPLIRELLEGDMPARRTAAEALGRIGSGQAVMPLIAAITADDDGLRRKAADALVAIGEPSIEPLIRLFAEDDDVHLTAALALERIGSPAIQPLCDALRDADSRLRVGSAEVLDRLGWSPSNDTEKAYYLIAKEHWTGLAREGTPAVGPLVRALSDCSDDIREGAAGALSRIGEPAVTDLIAALADDSRGPHAARVLEQIGSAAVAPLIAVLAGDTLRPPASQVLAAIGTPAIAQLVAALGKEGIGKPAARVLAAIGEPSIGPLIDALGAGEESTRAGAAEALLLQGKSAVGQLINALGAADEDVRMGAAGILTGVGAAAIPDLEESLTDRQFRVRLGAAEVLGRMGWKPAREENRIRYLIAKEQWTELARVGAPAVELLIQALNDPDEDIRMGVAAALGMIGRPAVAPLIIALREEDDDGSRRAIEALMKIGEPAVQALIQALGDEDWHVRLGSARALVRIGAPAVQPLISALQRESPAIKKGVAAALGKIGDARAVEPLIQTLMRDDWHVGRIAVHALGMMGDCAVETLIPVFREGSETAWRGAVAALVMIGSPARDRLPAALADEHYRVRAGAAETLDRLGWTPRNAVETAWYLIAKEQWVNLTGLGDPAIEPLISMLIDEDDSIRRRAAAVLGEMGDARAVQPLIQLLRDDFYSNRRSAAAALIKIGRASVPLLVQALSDKDEDVRRRAAAALGEISDSSALDGLGKALLDENWHVQKAAQEAREKILSGRVRQ